MDVLFPTLLTLGLPLVGLPLAIHLINLRRRRKVAWAAMDFLLESQKRNRRWIVLRQLLLLLVRTLAIAVVACMLAGPVMQSSWAALFGRGVTHHVLLLDDSYSMGDRHAAGTVQQEGTRVAREIVSTARGRADRQLVTLLPFSIARGLVAGASPPFDRVPLDATFLARFETYLKEMRASETSAGPVDGLEGAQKLPEPLEDETRIVYLLSDFRRAQWEEKSRLRELVSDVRAHCSQLRLIQCADRPHANLGIVALRPESGVRGAGVETWMETTIANYGDKAVAATTLEVRHNDARLPALQFEEIGPGEQATRRFRATLSPDGSQIVVQLPDDDLPADNLRTFAVKSPAAYPVLIVDESARGDDGRYLTAALSPGGKNVAGWTPQVERRSFLRRGDELQRFAAIVLPDAPRFDEGEVENLERYASGGGGVAFFVGPQVQPAFYNERLFRDGEGMLAAPLSHPSQLLRSADPSEPDLQVADAPLFRIFQGRRNSFLDLTKFDYYYLLDEAFKGAESKDAGAPGVAVLARLRNGAPLVMEKAFGDGTVVLHLFKLSPGATTLGPWSNFAATPAFPVYTNELVGKLSARRRAYEQRLVDEALDVNVSADDYLPDVTIRPPVNSGRSEFRQKLTPVDGRLRLTLPGPLASGVWHVTWTRRENSAAPVDAVPRTETTLAAVNVAPEEGDLHIVDEQELAASLDGIDYQWVRSSQFAQSSNELAGYNLSTASAVLLAALLIGDQLLAFAASYHKADPRRSS